MENAHDEETFQRVEKLRFSAGFQQIAVGLVFDDAHDAFAVVDAGQKDDWNIY